MNVMSPWPDRIPVPVLLLLFSVGLACAAETCAVEWVPCQGTNTVPEDQQARYRIQGIVSNIAYADLPSEVAQSFALTGRGDSYTRLSLEVEFPNYFAQTCVIEVDDWTVSSPSSDSPQCSFDECVSDCGTLTNGPIQFLLTVTNLRWFQQLGDAINTFPISRFQYHRDSTYPQPWDDDERTYSAKRSARDDDSNDDDGFCGCDDDCDDDSGGTNNACPTLCDDDYQVTSCNEEDLLAAGSCTSTTRYGQYHWSVRYSPGANDDGSCGGNSLDTVRDRSDCSWGDGCNHALHPTTALGFKPADIVGLYEQSLATGECPFSSACEYRDDDYVVSPFFHCEDDNSGNTCTRRSGAASFYGTDGLRAAVPGSSYGSAAGEYYPLTEELYRELANDGTNDSGSFSKTMAAADDFYRVPHCGSCASSKVYGVRYYHYDMTPLCTAYRFASSTSGVPQPAFSLDLDVSNAIGASASGFTYTTGMTGLSAQGSAVVPEVAATKVALEVVTDRSVFEEQIPSSIIDPQGDALIECSIDPEDLGTSNGNYPYPLDTCASGSCTPLDQTRFHGSNLRKLWYILPYEDMVASGALGGCEDFRNADGNELYTGYMTPYYDLNELQSQILPNTESGSHALKSCPHSPVSGVQSSTIFCRAANQPVTEANSGTSGFSSSPAYVAAAFDQYTVDHDRWLSEGGIASGEPEPLWSDYTASRFMPDTFNPQPAPNVWLSLENGAAAVFFLPEQPEDEEDAAAFTTELNLYFPASFTGDLNTVVSVDFSLLGSTSGFQDPSGSGKILPPQNLCPALADQCDTNNPTFDTCGYTLFSVAIADSGGSTGFVTLELDVSECEGFTIPPLCNAQDADCSTLTQNTFSVSVASGSPVTGALFFAIDPFAGVPGSPNCFTECALQIYQRLNNQRYAVSTKQKVPPCSETNTIEATGTYGNEPDPNIAYICSQVSMSPTSTSAPSATATPTFTPSQGASHTSTPSNSPTSSPSETPSRTMTATPTPGVPTATPTPSFGSDNSTGCGLCEFSCFTSPMDWIVSPCIWGPTVALIILVIVIIIVVSVVVSKKRKEKEQ